MNTSYSDFGSRYFRWLCFISLVFLLVTFGTKAGVWLPGPFGFVNQAFNLAWENNLAAWWSGTLLLLAALHAYDGFAVSHTKNPQLGYSWLIISLVLVCLSLDEVGSLHERVGGANSGPDNSAWWASAPFAVVLVGAISFAFWQLWRKLANRHHVILMIIGFGCFAAAAGQEYLEHAFTWPVWLTPVRLVVEEGTELVGMLILIWVAMQNTDGIVSRSSDNGFFFSRLPTRQLPGACHWPLC